MNNTEIVTKTTVGTISFNLNEVNKQLDQMLFTIENTQYTGDLTKINKARKEDRAKLSKMIASIDDKKKEVKKKYLLPLEAFNAQMDTLTVKINDVRDKIDAQVKDFEARARREKKADVLQAYDVLCEERSIAGEEKETLLAKIYNTKWENSSTSMSSIRNDLTESLQNYTSGIETISLSLCEDDIKAEALVRFKSALNLADALSYINQETGRRAEAKRREEARIAAEKKRMEEEAQRKIEAERKRIEMEAQRKLEEERRRIEMNAQRKLEEERRRNAEEQKKSATVRVTPMASVTVAPVTAPVNNDIVEVHLPDDIADPVDPMITVRIDRERWELAKRLLSNARIRYEEVNTAQQRTA